MAYTPNSDAIAKVMLRAMGLERFEELFIDVPEEVRAQGNTPETTVATELTVRRQLEALSIMTHSADDAPIFLGAGSYDHYVPVAVEQMATRADFTATYTPFQPEIIHDILLAIFEYQTAVCHLTDLDVANVSIYCGGSALAQACQLATETTERKLILLPETLNPDSMAIVKTYALSGLFELVVIPQRDGVIDRGALSAFMEHNGANVAAIVVQYPNFFGLLEEAGQIVDDAKRYGALAIMSVDPILLTMLKSPGEWGADIAVADGQTLGNSVSFAEPHLGFMAITRKLLCKLPEPYATKTLDLEGKRTVVLTLNARRQTRRENVNSDVFTIPSLKALTALMYLAHIAPLELKHAADSSYRLASYARAELAKAGFDFHHEAPFLREFAVKVDDPCGMNRYLMERGGIIGGFELSDGLLLAFTEKRAKDEIDELVYLMKEYQFGQSYECEEATQD
ncbi:MAG: aminomethyl-transferring glycine dehydrogenase subunit GcvPA [Planctomycetia bacterium]|nr:aminomethyl-transferring glycine dehydrogenase subunit GcvPA [Planctomycetia bacterium]